MVLFISLTLYKKLLLRFQQNTLNNVEGTLKTYRSNNSLSYIKVLLKPANWIWFELHTEWAQQEVKHSVN